MLKSIINILSYNKEHKFPIEYLECDIKQYLHRIAAGNESVQCYERTEADCYKL